MKVVKILNIIYIITGLIITIVGVGAVLFSQYMAMLAVIIGVFFVLDGISNYRKLKRYGRETKK